MNQNQIKRSPISVLEYETVIQGWIDSCHTFQQLQVCQDVIDRIIIKRYNVPGQGLPGLVRDVTKRLSTAVIIKGIDLDFIETHSDPTSFQKESS